MLRVRLSRVPRCAQPAQVSLRRRYGISTARSTVLQLDFRDLDGLLVSLLGLGGRLRVGYFALESAEDGIDLRVEVPS